MVGGDGNFGSDSYTQGNGKCADAAEFLVRVSKRENVGITRNPRDMRVWLCHARGKIRNGGIHYIAKGLHEVDDKEHANTDSDRNILGKIVD